MSKECELLLAPSRPRGVAWMLYVTYLSSPSPPPPIGALKPMLLFDRSRCVVLRGRLAGTCGKRFKKVQGRVRCSFQNSLALHKAVCDL